MPFLHSTLNEEVYMKQPPGFAYSNHPSYVCRLHKSLYGLKQAPRQWYSRLTSYILSLGLCISRAHSSLLIRKDSKSTMFVLVYVDDILVTRSDSQAVSKLLCQLSTTFAIKDLGDLNYFLGIEVIPHKNGLFLSQQKYIIGILSRTHFKGAKPIHTPLAANTQFSMFDSKQFDGPRNTVA